MKRPQLLVLVLAGLLLLAWLAPDDKDDRPAAAGSVPSSGVGPVAGAQARPVAVLSLRPRDSRAADLRLFAGTAVALPVPTETLPEATPVQQPVAPPLSFAVLGRYADGKNNVLFLQHMERNLVVREGDTLLEQYKVLQITDAAMRLRYLPLGEEQRLALDTK